MQLTTIIYLISFVFVAHLIYTYWHRKKIGKMLIQKQTMVDECKQMILGQKNQINQLQIFEEKYNSNLQFWKEVKAEIQQHKRNTEERKREFEFLATRDGLTKMDDGVLFVMITNHHRMSRTLLSNWLPYGKELGKIEILEQIEKRF